MSRGPTRILFSQGMVFDQHIPEAIEVFPSVGLRHSNEGVRANFGHTAFRYDIDDHVQQQRDTIWGHIQEAKVDWHIVDSFQTRRTDNIEIRSAEDEGREQAAR